MHIWKLCIFTNHHGNLPFSIIFLLYQQKIWKMNVRLWVFCCRRNQPFARVNINNLNPELLLVIFGRLLHSSMIAVVQKGMQYALLSLYINQRQNELVRFCPTIYFLSTLWRWGPRVKRQRRWIWIRWYLIAKDWQELESGFVEQVKERCFIWLKLTLFQSKPTDQSNRFWSLSGSRPFCRLIYPSIRATERRGHD